jgi:hypothetical protein
MNYDDVCVCVCVCIKKYEWMYANICLTNMKLWREKEKCFGMQTNNRIFFWFCFLFRSVFMWESSIINRFWLQQFHWRKKTEEEQERRRRRRRIHGEVDEEEEAGKKDSITVRERKRERERDTHTHTHTEEIYLAWYFRHFDDHVFLRIGLWLTNCKLRQQILDLVLLP